MRDFAAAPFIAIWEVTRACALRCVHCRAEALPHRDPAELDTAEGRRLLDRLAAFAPAPLVVLTGGDPMRRPDLAELVAHGHRLGLSVSLTPSATGAATAARLAALRAAGLARLAVSLDGASDRVHDAFRQVRGSHRHTWRIIRDARALGLPLQVNTTVCRRTVAELPALAAQVDEMGAALWALFFLVPVGRARDEDALDAAAIEGVLEWAADLGARAPFAVKTTEAPQLHRVLTRRGAGPPAAAPGPARPDALGRAGRAVTDGDGFLFVDHVGRICPSGFLPLAAGCVREDDPVAIYRDHPLFVALRDRTRLGGRCGRCEYRAVCGGSRARAYAATGDPLAEDPGCAWQPGGRAMAAIAGGSAGPTEPDVMAALGTVFDPELGMSVVELGLIYGVDVGGGRVRVTMTLTAPGCPVHEVMPRWIREAVRAVAGVEDVDVVVTFEPPWTPARIRRRA